MMLIDALIAKLATGWSRFVVPLRLRRPGLSLGRAVTFYGTPIISVAPESSIRVGERVVLCSDSRFTALGVSRRVVLRTLSPGAIVEIGSDTGISGGVICAAHSVTIGRECLLGADVMIVDTDFHPLDPVGRRFSQANVGVKPVVIEDNVFIGARTVVLKGVRIGKNAVVGAGSVVVSDIPPNCIAAGNPARVIRMISSSSDGVQ